MARRKSSTVIAQRTIGSYRCNVYIAGGGFGTVWKGVGKDRDDVVAIKLMNPDKAESREMRSLFEREYKICRGFDHPGLLHYLDYGEFESIPYMVMEFFPGSVLTSALGSDAADAYAANLKTIVKNIAVSLEYIHGRGIVHRDVKPQNVMVMQDGTTKLIDFSNALRGLGKWVSLGRRRSGSPSYMAPEQILNRTILPAADMYSFGALLYEVLTGRPPFVGDNDKAILHQHLKATPQPLTRLNPRVSTAMDKLVRQMLQKKPQNRVHDMQTFLARLSRVELYSN